MASALTKSDQIRQARTCYDHMAGKLGVAVTNALIDLGYIKLKSKSIEPTEEGIAWFAALDIDVAETRKLRRKFAYPCLDWSERRPHLAGSLGAKLCQAFFKQGLIERRSGSRALILTKGGEDYLSKELGIALEFKR